MRYGRCREQAQDKIANGSANIDQEDDNPRGCWPLEARLALHEVDEFVEKGRQYERQAEAERAKNIVRHPKPSINGQELLLLTRGKRGQSRELAVAHPGKNQARNVAHVANKAVGQKCIKTQSCQRLFSKSALATRTLARIVLRKAVAHQ